MDVLISNILPGAQAEGVLFFFFYDGIKKQKLEVCFNVFGSDILKGHVKPCACV